MPVKKNIPFDFAAWRRKVNLSQKATAAILGISAVQLYRFEQHKECPANYRWAAYGIEKYLEEKKQHEG